MRARLGQVLLILACGMVTGISTRAGDTGRENCPGILPEPFIIGQPFLLNDPQSGLMLYVESDGRHMAAIKREGQILWQRNLFDDPRLETEFPPPPPFLREPPLSTGKWRRQINSYVSHLSIDRIGVVSDCEMHVIDHVFPVQVHGHYIRAGSGTHIFWLLDARTGDFQMEEVN